MTKRPVCGTAVLQLGSISWVGSDMKRPSLILVLGALAVSCACGGSSPTAVAPSSATAVAPSSATVSSVAVTGPTDFMSIGQTVQLTALATFVDGATQNVSAAASWRVVSAGATVTSGGLVTAVTSGTVTIMATYQRKSGMATVQISPTTPSQGSMSATIDGAPWVASYVWVTKLGANAAFPSGRLNILGTNGFTGQYEEVVVTVPAVVGTYSSELDVAVWIPAGAPGLDGDVSGTVTLTALTATGATGTFSFRGAAAQAVTSGVFNVTF